jgi:hypothetical protein
MTRRSQIDHAQAIASMREAWTKEGERLLAGPEVPSRRDVIDAAVRVLLAGLRGHASITAGARLLGTSRRALRDSMKRHGVYRAEEPTA